jgi:phosphoglycolate phosphatase-like HAD superfamily hydrolase
MITDIFIDLDGPIFDGRMRHYQCYCDILFSSGETFVLSLTDYWQRKRSKVDIVNILASTGTKISKCDYHELWMKNIESTKYLALDKLQPNAKETLEKWSIIYRLWLVTCRQYDTFLMSQLEDQGLKALFYQVLRCNIDDGNLSKYNQIKPFHFGPSVFIGDTEMDMESAAKLCMPSLAITSGLRDKAFLKADYYFEQISDIEDSFLANL